MTNFVTRAYNKIELNDQGVLVKTSDERRLGDEINYYIHLPEEMRRHFARMVGYGIGGTNKLQLEYFPAPNLAQYISTKGAGNPIKWITICNKIKNIWAAFESRKDIGFAAQREEMYIKKTFREYCSLVKANELFLKIESYDKLIINDREYHNFKYLWPRIENIIQELLINNQNFTIIHGDLCWSNILYASHDDNHVLKLVDPRGRFGGFLSSCYGDLLYDKAKLRHSCSGYEDIIYDKFDVAENGNDCKLRFYNRATEEVGSIFRRELGLDDLKVRLIEGCIFIGMCARHYDSQDRQLAMYLTGVKLLNEVLDEYSSIDGG